MGKALSKTIDAIIEAELTATGTGAVVAVIQGGERIHAKGYGFANVELGVPVTLETVFPICSISKPITATLVMMLVEDGLLDLDAPVRQYLPNFAPDRDAITLRHLLTHTSGLANYNAGESFVRRDGRLALPAAERLAFLEAQPVEALPGERYAYCNTGYVLTGFIIEAVTGRLFHEVLRERVFEPCGMTDTVLLGDHGILPNRASGYELGPKGLRNSWYQAMSWLGGAGGIACPVDDLVRWSDAFEAGRLVSAKSRMEMLTPLTLNDGTSFDYGLGWGTGIYHGHAAHLHTGGGFGYACELVRFPDDDTTIALLTNLYMFPFHRVAMSIVRQALNLPEPVSESWPPSPRDAYAGAYRSPGGQEIKFLADPGGLAGLVQCGEHQFHAAGDIEVRYRFSDPSPEGFTTVTSETPLFPPFTYRRVGP